jgi:hypothetical protein
MPQRSAAMATTCIHPRPWRGDDAMVSAHAQAIGCNGDHLHTPTHSAFFSFHRDLNLYDVLLFLDVCFLVSQFDCLFFYVQV